VWAFSYMAAFSNMDQKNETVRQIITKAKKHRGRQRRYKQIYGDYMKTKERDRQMKI
jgi:hypothetical protein